MLARQLRLAAPMGSRSCAFLTKMKTMEGEATKLAATMPEELKGIALGGVRAANAYLEKRNKR